MTTIAPDDIDGINPDDIDLDVDDGGSGGDDVEEFVSADEDEEDPDADPDDDADVDADPDADPDADEEVDGGSKDDIGGIVPDELDEADVEPIEEEDLLGDDNKKITHHDEILLLHPESKFHNYDEIAAAAVVTRNENNIIVDMLHTTIPMMTKYEKTKVIGQRTKQLDVGNPPFVRVDRPTLDNSIIAEQELREKKLPFIIQRPLPNGGFEYWHVKDLEVF
jgi:DNA-directed RNA polymerase subunit K/omega